MHTHGDYDRSSAPTQLQSLWHTFVVIVPFWFCIGHDVLAQEPSSTPSSTPRVDLADVWLADALRAQARADTFGRYVAAPTLALTGAALLVVPPLASPRVNDLTTAATATGMIAGALMLTAAIGTWANPELYAARHWFASWGTLGFAVAGVALMFVSNPHGDEHHRLAQHELLVFGAVTAVSYTAEFILELATPPGSAAELQRSMQGRAASEREARLGEFLTRRDEQRRLHAVLSAPFPLTVGVSQLLLAHETATASGRAVICVVGGALIALTAIQLVYELLRTPDWQRFDAGEAP
jgi:hypothetical protein